MPVPSGWSQKLKQFVDEWKRNPNSLDEEYWGDAPLRNFVLTEQADSWNDLLAWSSELQGSWCYRGQRKTAWPLLTTLDRAVRRDHSSNYPGGIRVTGYHHLDREAEQSELLFRFQQQAHLYIENLPTTEDLASWFALMQHHGAPTQLLDWTESLYVAAYFAFEQEAQEKRSAVWAIDLDWLERRGRELLTTELLKSGNASEARAHWENTSLLQCQAAEKAVIIRVNPMMLNERRAVQQGILLCKLFHEAPFSVTLMRMMIHPETPTQPVVRKLELDISHRAEFLRRLKAMNIHRASLFPGLDGFAQSLRLDLETKS